MRGNKDWIQFIGELFNRQVEVKKEVKSDADHSDTTDEEELTLTPSDLEIQHQVAYDSEVKNSECSRDLFMPQWYMLLRELRGELRGNRPL